MRRGLLTLAVAVGLAVAPTAAAQSVDGRVIVGFADRVGEGRAAELVERLGGRIERRLGRIGAVTVRARRGRLLRDVRRRLRARS